MDRLFDDHAVMTTLLQWLNLGSERDDLQMCASLSLGNLARNDKHCIELVQKYRVVEPLVNALRNTSSIKVQHAVLSILKNLSIPAGNKDTLGSSGVIGLMIPLMKKDLLQPVQFAAVGIIKHLASGNYMNCRRILAGDEQALGSENQTPFSQLVTLIQDVDDISVKSEGTRAVVHLIKGFWGHVPPEDFEAQNKLRPQLNTPIIVQLVATMAMLTKYPALQNEGIIGLTLLVMDNSRGANPTLDAICAVVHVPTPQQDSSEAANQGAESSSSSPPPPSTQSSTSAATSSPLLDALIAILKNDSERYPDEMRVNSCIMLEKSAKMASGPHKHYLRERVPPAVTPLLDRNRVRLVSDVVKKEVEKVLRVLD